MRKLAMLEIKSDYVIKGRRLEGVRKIGIFDQVLDFYKTLDIEEYIIHDAVASLYDRPIDHELMRRFGSGIFLPVSMSGGIRSIQCARKLIEQGCEKVFVNSILNSHLGVIKDVSDTFGSQAIGVSLEVKKIDGTFMPFFDNGRELHAHNLMETIARVLGLGCGEILITSIDRDGTDTGVDQELIEEVLSATNIPVIYKGGVNEDHILFLEKTYPELSGVAIASDYIRQYNG